MSAPKKAQQPTSPNVESDGKKEPLNTLTVDAQEQNEEKRPEKRPEKQEFLRSVSKVIMAAPTEVLNQSSRNAITFTQGLSMWEDHDGKGIFVVSTDPRVRGIDLIPWANIRKVSYHETNGPV